MRSYVGIGKGNVNHCKRSAGRRMAEQRIVPFGNQPSGKSPAVGNQR